MSRTLTLAINLVTQDGSEKETAIRDEITVTHLAARVFTPDDCAPSPHISPGLVIALPTGGDNIELTVDDESIRLSSGMALIANGAARMALPETAGAQSEHARPLLRIIELNARVGEAAPLRDLLDLPLLLDAEQSHALNCRRRVACTSRGTVFPARSLR